MTRATRLTIPLFFAAVALGAALVVPAPASAKTSRPHWANWVDDDDRADRKTERFSWHDRIARGKTLEIRGINGSIHAELASGAEASVEAMKSARKSSLDDVKIEVVEHADGILICARYRTRDGGYADCEPGNGGERNIRNNDVSVDFKVRVPAGVDLALASVNGDLEAEGIRSDVEATTVNGAVLVKTSGHASASTVNGSITAEMGDAKWTGRLEFGTVNGSVRLILPHDLDSEVSARTTNGDITTDFDLTVRGRFSPRRLQGTIGRGGRSLSIGTVNGGIQLTAAN